MAIRIFDRVKQLCDASFTGTGNIVIDGTNAIFNGFAKFSDVLANGNQMYYVVESTNSAVNEWEVGIGTYASGTGQISRDEVIASSNSNAAVNFAAGEKVVYIAALSRTLDGQVKMTPENDSSPGSSDDDTAGYSRGSITYGGGAFWICADPSTGAAVWNLLSGPLSSEPGIGYSVIFPAGSDANAIIDLTQTGPETPGVSGIIYDAGASSFNEFTARTAWRKQTNNNTPTPIGAVNGVSSLLFFALPDAGVGSIEAMVHACADGAYKVWKVTVGFERHFDTSDYVINLGTVTKTVVFDSGTTTGWDVTAAAQSTYQVALNVTGDNVAAAIFWYADVALTFVPVPAF